MPETASKNQNPFLYQAHVLSERYLDAFLGDLTSLFFLIFQPLAVAFFTGMVWQGGGTPTLYFVLVFSAIFFGCVNACREIVKESAIFQRERLVGLKILPYLASKIWVLGILGLAQTLLFYFGVRYFIALPGNALVMVFVLYLALFAGTALGLFISSFVHSDVMALSLVPVFLIPQLLFSKLVMPQRSMSAPVEWMETLTLVKWSYQAMEEVVAQSPDWLLTLKSLLVLGLLALGLLGLSSLILKLKDSF